MSVERRIKMRSKFSETIFLGGGHLFLAAATISFAGVNMDVAHKLTLENPPLDVVSTPDGKFMFVLSEKGIISAFDQNGVLQNEIHVGKDSGAHQNGSTRYPTPSLPAVRENPFRSSHLIFLLKSIRRIAPSKGPQNAPVVLVVFSDFQCPYCARLAPKLEQMLKQYPKSVRSRLQEFSVKQSQIRQTGGSGSPCRRAPG